MRRNHRRPAQAGLTLIEAMMVLCVVGILIGSALPDMTSVRQQWRLRIDAGHLMADLQSMRTEAVALNHTVRLSVDQAGGGSCYVVHVGGACSCAADGQSVCQPGATALRVVGLPAAEGIQLSASASHLVMDPVHGTVTPTATFRFRSIDGREIHHVVNLLGRVRSCAVGLSLQGVPPC